MMQMLMLMSTGKFTDVAGDCNGEYLHRFGAKM